jgi:hypothetical protein
MTQGDTTTNYSTFQVINSEKQLFFIITPLFIRSADMNEVYKYLGSLYIKRLKPLNKFRIVYPTIPNNHTLPMFFILSLSLSHVIYNLIFTDLSM